MGCRGDDDFTYSWINIKYLRMDGKSVCFVCIFLCVCLSSLDTYHNLGIFVYE